MELSSFIAAHAFVTKTVLLIHQCCRCCRVVLAQSQGFLFFPLCLEVGKGLGEDQLGQLTMESPIPYINNVMLSSKTSGRGKRKVVVLVSKVAGIWRLAG